MTTHHDPLDDSAQVADQARADEFKRLQRELEVGDVKWLMGHKQGRRVMWRLLGMTGLFRNPHGMGQSASDTAFRCGEQNIGQQLIAEIHGLCPEQYHVMVKEQHEHAKRLERSSGTGH